MIFERDTFLYPVELDEQLLVIVEDTGGGANPFSAEPIAGTYYQHADETMHDLAGAEGEQHYGLWRALIDILNNGTTARGTLTGTPVNTYSVSVITPPDSPGYVNGGLEIRAVAATHPFQIDFSGSPATTIPPQWLGCTNPNQTASLSSVTDGADQVIVLPGALRGRLVTQTLSPSGRAGDKHKIPYVDMRDSSPVVRDARSVLWDKGYRRRYLYENVFGALVGETRPAITPYSAMARIDAAERNVSWQTLWDAFVAGKRVIVVHDSSDDLQVVTHSYEVCKFASSKDWEQFARVTGQLGDLHRISFQLWVDQLFAEYDF